MTSAEAYGVELEDVRSHGRTVAEFGDRVAKAADAIDEIDNNDWTIFGPLAAGLIEAGVGVFNRDMHKLTSSTHKLTEHLSGALDGAATTYERLEDEAAANSKAIEDSI